jgi:type I restriction enzyme, S subunit
MYGQGKTRGRVATLEIAAAMNQACAAIQVGRRLDHRYLFYYLSSKYDEIRSLSNAGSQDNLSGELVRRLLIAVPPLQEQSDIARVLTDFDAQIDTVMRIIAKKQAIKCGMTQQLLTGSTRLPGFTEPWAEVRLRDEGSTYGGLTGKTKGDFGSGVASFVTFMEVMAGPRLLRCHDAPVDVQPGEDQKRVLRGDVLFNGSSETPEEVALATAVEFDTSPTTYLNSFCFGYRLNDQSRIHPTYLAYYFRSGRGRALVSSLAQGATRYNISKAKLLELTPLLPSFAEQTAIVNILIDIETEIERLRDRLAKTRNIKQGMMQELLTGRTRLPVAEGAA